MLNLRDIVHIAAHVSLPRMAALSHFPCEAPSVIVVLVVLPKARGGVIAVVVVQPEMPEASPSYSLLFRPTQQHAPPSETSQASPAQLSGKRFLSAECALYRAVSSFRQGTLAAIKSVKSATCISFRANEFSSVPPVSNHGPVYI